ncbi:fasciclin domain-containing protein [Emticicia sp. TH156]|uniref:fasciclin domain-containing protein n=1 Tax=Emticicia sp. TH156 TaxID=2067454 RepID=UPI000C75A914|nr:fasciclin domain-containing protein [Emticicia sp. TH156]PLK42523.1 fasciclin [Emticicia sp. TH156]
MKTISLLLVSAFISFATLAQESDAGKVSVGGAEMSSYKNVVTNLQNSKDHTKFISAVKAAGLSNTLQGPGPFTVLAPTNDAFARIASRQSKSALNKVLLYHVIDGTWDSNSIRAALNGNGGSVSVKTMQGGYLKFTTSGDSIVVTDESGAMASITSKPIYQSNGITYVVDSILMPSESKMVVSGQ